MPQQLGGLVAWSGPGTPGIDSSPGISDRSLTDITVGRDEAGQRLTAIAPTLLASGLFWSVDQTAEGPRLLIGRSLGDVVGARSERTTMDEAYIRAFALYRPSPQLTPYREVHRLPPGVMACWRDPQTEPRLSVVSGPDAWPREPNLEGPEALDTYQRAFDTAVTALVGAERPIAALMSGGLDSTYVVASLARHASRDRPVHAFTHVPHPDAQLVPADGVDPDESAIAAAMQRRYPERVRVMSVFNEDLVTPLDASQRTAVRCWVPVVNPDNEVWFAQIERLADELGAKQLFSGEQGNYAFSYEPDAALTYYLSRGDVRAAIGLRPRERASDVSAREAAYGVYGYPVEVALRRTAGRTLAALRLRERRRGAHVRLLGIPVTDAAPTGPRLSGRETYLRALADCDTSLGAVMSPDGCLVPIVDPFRSEEVLRIAAAITPLERSRGPYPRGFARRLGEGRVPDEIRLRTRSGGQACDSWFAIRNSRDVYLDAADALTNTPVLGGWIDAKSVRRVIEGWPWGQVTGPDELELQSVHLILTLADFVRMTQQRLQSLPAAAQS